MKALINKKKLSSFQNEAADTGQNPWNMNYNAENIEFVGSRKESGGLFGKKSKDLFIFRILDSGGVQELSGDGAEAYLVIACK